MSKDDNKPATKSDVRKSQTELAGMFARSFQTVATKEDLKRFTTKEDLKALATKSELKAVKQELKDDIKDTKNTVKRVLSIVELIEENTRGLISLPDKVAQNEIDIINLKARLH